MTDIHQHFHEGEGGDPKSLKRGSVAWMVNNHVCANLLMVMLMIGGALSAIQIKKEVFPEFTFDAVSINMVYPGTSPAEVEQGILLAIEEAVRGVENVKKVTSVANEGSAGVTIEYEAGSDEQKIYQDVQQAVQRIQTFPEDAEEPRIALAARRRNVMDIQLYGDVPEWALRNLAEEVRDRLLQTPGITQVELEGARQFEVHVMPSREALRTYGLTLQDLANRVARTSVEVPGGSVDTQAGEILLRFNERRDYAQEFSRIPVITTAEGAVLKLGDIATVTESFEDSNRLASYNGARAIGVGIYRVGNQTPNSVCAAARGALERIEADLPAGVRLVINDDDSEIYNQRLFLLLKNMGMGLTLVIVLLGLFLEPRIAFWVMMGIPISILGSFLILPALGASLNMISMFAFLVALGIVVDDAIVVGENVHDYRSQGLPPVEAAIRGTGDVGMPVIFSVLTNCVTFIPLALMPGIMGKFWYVIPLVVISVFMISLIESLYVLPAHLAALAPRPRNPLIKFLRAGQQYFSRGFEWFVLNVFDPFLLACIKCRYLVVAVCLATLAFVSAYALSGRMGMTLMPKVEADYAFATARLPVGSPLEKLIAVRRHLEQAAERVTAENGGELLSSGIFSIIRENTLDTRVYLTEPGVRPISTAEYTRQWRAAAGELAGVDTLRFESDRGGPGRGPSVNVELSHADVDTLEQASVALALQLESFPSLSDIDDGYQPGKEQLNFTLKEEGRALGLSSSDVARQIRFAFEGAEAIRQQRGRNEVKVRVLLPEEQRRSEYDIEQLMIRTPAGKDVPLRQIAAVRRSRAYTSINHTDGRRTLEVTANVTPDELTNQVLETLRTETLPALVRDYPGLSWDFSGRQSDMRDSLNSLKKSYLFALLAIYALLAIPFRNYIQPFIVMTAIPFGVVGAILGHLLMDFSLSVISVMGIIALSGVVINDSLVMIVYANEQRRKGMNAFEAIHNAGVRRFRPILLTTLTTFGGLAPMIFETSRQARFMVPMAISLGYGLLFATVITLLLVPSLYLIQEDVIQFCRRVLHYLLEDAPAKTETAPRSA